MTAAPGWVPSGVARQAWLELVAAVHAVRRVPCQVTPAVWWSTKPGDVDAAVGACRGCPVRGECLAYALVGCEREGVWGGTAPADRKVAGV